MLVLNDQGGFQMDISENIVGTLRAQEHGHQPLLFESTLRKEVKNVVFNEKLLGISVSVNDREMAMNRIFSDESLESLSVIPSDIGTLLVNFRFPSWDKDSLWDCLSRLERFKIPVRYMVNRQDFQGRGLPPMNLMRNQSISMMKCKFYAFLDENFLLRKGDSSKRGAGLQILDAVHFMLKNPDCGVVSFKQRFSKNFPKLSDGEISVVPFDVPMGNSFGMVLRDVSDKSLLKGLIPAESLNSCGAGDDLVAIAHVLSFGYFPAILMKSRLSSIPVDDFGASTRAVMEINNCGVIKKLFNPNYVFPNKGAYLVSRNIGDREKFLETVPRLNYFDMEVEQEIFQIRSMAEGRFDFSNEESSGKAFGVCENAESAFLMKDSHTSLTTGGGKPGQGYPCVLQDK